MSPLHLARRIGAPDDVYAALVELTVGLDPEAALRAQARLILLLVNHIGDIAAIARAIELARDPPGDA